MGLQLSTPQVSLILPELTGLSKKQAATFKSKLQGSHELGLGLNLMEGHKGTGCNSIVVATHSTYSSLIVPSRRFVRSIKIKALISPASPFELKK